MGSYRVNGLECVSRDLFSIREGIKKAESFPARNRNRISHRSCIFEVVVGDAVDVRYTCLSACI